MSVLVKATLSFLGAGYAPLAPGTAASGVAILGFSCILYACGPEWAWASAGAAAVLLAAATVALGARAEAHSGVRDPGWVVSDEAAGQLVAAAGATVGAEVWDAAGWWVLVLAFAAFRVLDVAKPFPIGRLQRLPGGWGILADDLAAGAVAAAVAGGLAGLG